MYVGIEETMLSAPRLDNQTSVAALLEAIMKADREKASSSVKAVSSSKTEARPLRPRGSQCPKTPSMVCRPVWAISCVQRRPIKSLMLRRLTDSSTTVANRSQFKSASTSLSAGEGVRSRTVASAGSSRSARASAARSVPSWKASRRKEKTLLSWH